MTQSNLQQQSRDYQRVARAIDFLASNVEEQPTLKELTNYVGVSEYHFQRIFSRWAGVSPKRFLQYLTKEYAKKLLVDHSVEEAAMNSGLSTKSRLHDLMVSFEAMTPGEYKQQCLGMKITFGVHPTLFGECLIAVTQRGICKLSFIQNDQVDQAIAELYNEWALAHFSRDELATAPYIESIFCSNDGQDKPIHLLLKGTKFQIKVWEALINIPPGTLTTYETIAREVGSAAGVRAVGSAIGRNSIAFVIPCHRVIRKSGELSQYRWGVHRKQAMIGWESACHEI